MKAFSFIQQMESLGCMVYFREQGIKNNYISPTNNQDFKNNPVQS